MNLLLRMTGLFHLPYFLFKPVFRIRLSFHADPGSQKCPFGSGSRPLIFYSNPDPRGVKIKKGNLYHQIFNKIVKDDIKTLLKISKQKVLQKDLCFYVSVLFCFRAFMFPCFYVSSSVFT